MAPTPINDDPLTLLSPQFEFPIQSNESEEVVILVHQDPIYEMVVAHYYSCTTDTANKVLMVGALTSSTSIPIRAIVSSLYLSYASART